MNHQFFCKLGMTTTAVTTLLSLSSIATSQAITITSIAGDKDCFGTGSNTCNTLAVANIVHEATDQDFDLFTSKTFQWLHTYSFPASASITSAILKIVSLDIEDNGAGDGLGGLPYDDRLFIDDVEVSGAFDNVFTPDGNAFTLIPVNVTVFNLNSTFFSLLGDGNAAIRLNSFGGTRPDGIAIDYAELEIQTVSEPQPPKSIPEPSNILGLGLVGLGLAATKVKSVLSKKTKSPTDKLQEPDS
jgi:hypothetical protein